MSSKIGILQTSALPESTKSNTITQEIIRRMSSIDRGQTIETRLEVLETNFTELSNSGYCTDEIERFTTPGLWGYERRAERELSGGQPVHRKGQMIRKSTDDKKLRINKTWFQKGADPDKTESGQPGRKNKHKGVQAPRLFNSWAFQGFNF